MSFVHGSGAIEWLWNTNSYMTEGNEAPIGALRADGTEKAEATVMRDFARFAAALSPHLRNPQPAQVAVIASQSAQYSALSDMQIEAQRKAVRAFGVGNHLTPYLVYENQIDEMGSPKLAILPSAQALSEKAWQQLLKYVNAGGNLLITGPIDRDEHWQRVNRAAKLIPGAQAVPLTHHDADSTTPDASLSARAFKLSFDQQAQSWLESLHMQAGPIGELSHGKGNIFWTSDPVELAQGDEPVAKIYSYVVGRANGRKAEIHPDFDFQKVLAPGVVAYPIALEDSVLYVFVSDSAEDQQVELRDRATGAPLKFTLPAQHAALALIGKKEKAVIAKYGY